MNEKMIEILKSKFCQVETGETIYRYDLIVGGLGYFNTSTTTLFNDNSEREIDEKNVIQLLDLWMSCRANPNLATYKISHGYKVPDILNGKMIVRLPESELELEIKELAMENKMRKLEEDFV